MQCKTLDTNRVLSHSMRSVPLTLSTTSNGAIEKCVRWSALDIIFINSQFRFVIPPMIHSIYSRHNITIHFTQYQIENLNTTKKTATFVLGMAEVTTVVLTETQNYPLSACISDTGGAAGLFLGLHVLGKSRF